MPLAAGSLPCLDKLSLTVDKHVEEEENNKPVENSSVVVNGKFSDADENHINDNKEEEPPQEIVLSLPRPRPPPGQQQVQVLPKSSKTKRKSGKKKTRHKSVSEQQKLLRRRFEAKRAAMAEAGIKFDEEDDYDLDGGVPWSYSVVYFSWAVSDSDETDSEEDETSTSCSTSLSDDQHDFLRSKHLNSDKANLLEQNSKET